LYQRLEQYRNITMSIRRLATETVQRLRANQVIVDLVSVVKELCENSIDAGATAIRVTIKSCQSIEVVFKSLIEIFQLF
jgi:DNA mismatch repair ATPase MutL